MTLWYQQSLSTLAFCWRLDRADGVALGFTAHDRDLVVAGFVYRAAPGMLPSAIEQTDGFDVDTLDVTGALTSDAITADDLAAGRWDGARVSLCAVDWTDPANALPLARGELGEVAQKDTGFTAELRGPTAVLAAPAIEQTSPSCRAELGDRRCRVDLAPRTRLCMVVSVIDEVTLAIDGTTDGDIYAYGRLRWLDGANSGLSSQLLSSTAGQIVLREPPPFVAAAGARIELLEGCDKSFATCGSRFTNQLNFQGEPHLPGNDLLARYPDA